MTKTNANTAPVIGLTVPEFRAATTGGEFSLLAQRSSTLVLYFYPKDNTPGCTTEAMQFRDLHEAFCTAGASIFGVSRDSLKSHQNFKDKLGLPFELISDGDETICRLFDVLKTRTMYGRLVLGIQRSTFIIDTAGILRCEWRGIKADGHAAEVLAAIKAL